MEANKVVITRNIIFVGKGNVNGGFFKLNLIPKTMNDVSSPLVLNVESCEL